MDKFLLLMEKTTQHESEIDKHDKLIKRLYDALNVEKELAYKHRIIGYYCIYLMKKHEKDFDEYYREEKKKKIRFTKFLEKLSDDFALEQWQACGLKFEDDFEKIVMAVDYDNLNNLMLYVLENFYDFFYKDMVVVDDYVENNVENVPEIGIDVREWNNLIRFIFYKKAEIEKQILKFKQPNK